MCLLATVAMYAQDEQPIVQNGELNQIPKDSGSDCSCSQWINKDLGDQAETSTTGLTDEEKEGIKRAVKFDEFESDLMYQEIAVIPNRNYKLTYEARINSLGDGASEPSQLEVRVLRGSGYKDGYTPTYYTVSTEQPQSGFGYDNIAIAELPENNIVEEVRSYPGDTDRRFYEVTFQSGDETSIALFFRGIGRPNTPPVDDKEYAWSAGEDETFIYSVTLTNESSSLSVKDVFASQLKVFPNPAKTNLSIVSGTRSTIDSVALYNILGLKVFETNNLVNNAIDVSKMAKGVYILKVNSGQSTASKRVVIK